MTARQIRILAGSAGALAAVMLGLVGCVAASQPAADTIPRPASQTAAAGTTSPQTAARPGTAARPASPLIRCADPLGDGGPPAAAGGARGTTGLVMLCGPVTGHCPPGFREFYPRIRSGGRPPRPYPVVCVAPFRGHPVPPQPRLTPVPLQTRRPLHTMPPKPSG